MKKSLLNIAINMAFGSAIFSGTVLSTQAYANEMSADNNTSNHTTTETYLYPGMGAGAVSGALVAGPIGFLVGGLIGGITGASHEVSNNEEVVSALAKNNSVENVALETIAAGDIAVENSDHSENIKPTSEKHSIQVAQLGEINAVVSSPIESQQLALLDILTADLSLDIYFRSGSSNIENFYPARLSAIADLMNTMDELELHLDGYTDRRGNKSKNIALANQRIEKVREQLIDAGVDENRIISKAFGEIKMVSKAGDLEAYTFDRKVVIRFQRITVDSIASMNTVLSELETQPSVNNTSTVLADTRIEF